MPRRNDIHRILIIGSGPIVIGQACEFDYSGTQACKALRAEGYEVVLVNSNPATIMTDPELADRTYIEPLTVAFVEEIIRKERPDALLSTVGGQTGLNLAIELAEAGVLEKYGVELIGAKDRRDQEGRRPPAVQRRDAEDRPRDAAVAARQHASKTGVEFAAQESAIPSFCVPASRWAAPAAASPTTAKSSKRSSSAASTSRPVHEV